VAYLALPTGVPVLDDAGARAGTVAAVLADEGADIFHGLIVDGPDGYRFADREQVAQIYEHGVRLAVSGRQLHQIVADPVAREAAADLAANPLQDGLRRAGRWLSDRTNTQG
jgi:hypothetical protein